MTTCPYRIYSCFETNTPSGSIVAGSLLLDLCPQTEGEAKKMVASLEKKAATFYETFISLRGPTRYIYIENKLSSNLKPE